MGVNMNIRKPVVSGKFYPSSARALREMITSFVSFHIAEEPSASLSSPRKGRVPLPLNRQGEDEGEVGKKISAIGIIVPHAGYVCSGVVAGAVYNRLSIP